MIEMAEKEMAEAAELVKKLGKKIETLESENKELKAQLGGMNEKLDGLYANLVEQAEDVADKPTTPDEDEEPKDELKDFVRELKRKEEAKVAKREAKQKVRTPEEIHKQSADVLSRMIKRVQED